MMRSALLVSLLVFQLSYGEHSVCLSSDPPTLVKLSELPLKQNSHYQFSISNYINSATILRNQNGTFILGDFSTLSISTERNQYQYTSHSFSFKYPPQHRVAEVNNEMVELQIVYDIKDNFNAAWKHRRVGLSVTFLLTEYAPQTVFTLGKQITHHLQNGTTLDLQALLPLVPGLSMFLYKGTHTSYPEDDGFLWLVRKELLLMSEFEFQQVKSFIFQHHSKEQLAYHGLATRISDINQINQARPEHPPINEAPPSI